MMTLVTNLHFYTDYKLHHTTYIMVHGNHNQKYVRAPLELQITDYSRSYGNRLFETFIYLSHKHKANLTRPMLVTS
jgi:hypothetical protein